jgi:ABC-type antimicrobial peptide transport system permease subunit
LDVVSTVQKLRDFHLVEHTYMSVFQAIGGLGLMLGTLGLGIVLVRNTIERKQELAMLRALGFRQLTLSVMLLIENSFLILVGLGIGTVSALLAVAPHLLSMGNPIPLFSLVITLVLVLAVGVGSNLIVIRATINLPLLSTLKSEL